LADDSKAYIVRTISYAEEQAGKNFPIIDRLPFHMGTIVRREVDVEKVSIILLDKNRTQLITSNLVNNIDSLKNLAQTGVGQISSIGLSFASSLTSFITTFSVFLLLTFFIILERRSLLHWFFSALPHDIGHYFHSRQNRISRAIHSWLRAQLVLAGFMFAINLIGLYIGQLVGIPVKNIFSLALIAGAMEFVPYAGPIIAFVVGFVTVLVSPLV
jgi:predicted PurR-regulated permease PerM